MSKKVLFLTTQKLLPANYGAAIYSLGIIKYISSTGADIDIVSFTEDEDYTKEQKDYLEKFSSNVYTIKHKWKNVKFNFSFKYPNSIRKYIRKDMKEVLIKLNEKKEYDIVLFDHLQMAEYIKLFSVDKSILINHNVESKIWSNYLENCSTILKPLIRRNAMGIYKYEKKAIGWFNKVIVLTEQDRETLSQMNTMGDFIIMKPYMYMEPVKTDKEIYNINNKILFIGSYSWYPNENAAKFLIYKVMPLLREMGKGIKLYLVGKDPTDEMCKIAQEFKDIIVTGKVEDLDIYYRDCDIMVNPIQDGSGLNIKVVEAMGKGIPIVSSQYGLRGFDGAENIAIEYKDSTDCAEKIVELLSDSKKMVKIRNNAFKYYKSFIEPDETIKEIFYMEN